jgi:hypothetical protein
MEPRLSVRLEPRLRRLGRRLELLLQLAPLLQLALLVLKNARLARPSSD